MEKLIELVYYYNSHLEKGKIGIGLTTSVKENGREVPFDKEKEIRKYEDYIISKKYGFIERLVENDKIDFKSENYLLKSYDGYFDDDILCIVNQDCNTYENRIKVEFNKIDSLIMILSIQDNPIEYLCSILKE